MDDVLICDVCNKEITDYRSMYHFSGMINNTFSNHIHVCTDCYHFINDDLYGVSINNGVVRSVLIKSKPDKPDIVIETAKQLEKQDVKYNDILNDDEICALLKGVSMQ